MKTVVYNMFDFKIRYITEKEIIFSDLKNDEDFMSVELWNTSEDKESFPIIN